jgi:hypothetical protein
MSGAKEGKEVEEKGFPELRFSTEFDDILLLTTHTALASSVSRNDDWLVDSDCTSHVTKCKDWLISYLKSEPLEMAGANDQKVHSDGVGEVKINLKNNVQKTISEVMFFP